MSMLNVGIIQHKSLGSIEENKSSLARKITELSGKGASLIVLQELHDTNYFCQNEDVKTFDLAQSIPGESSDFYADLAKKQKVVIVCSLFEKRAAGIYHNTAVVFEKDGSIAGKYRKMHIPDDPAYYEKFYFTPGDLGFEPITTSVGKIGVLVCWDQWFPEAARIMALKGAEILIYPTAIGWDSSDDETEKRNQLEAWKISQRAHAIANGMPVVSVNRVGFEKNPMNDLQGIQFWGNSFACGPQGELLFEANEKEDCEKIVEIDTSKSELVRRWWPFLRDRRIDYYSPLLKRFDD